MRINPNKNIPRINSNVKLVYPDLSYKIMSVLFKVHNELGSHLQEKYYQRAIGEELNKRNIPFEKEKIIPIYFNDKKIGSYSLDFVVEQKIALEVKRLDFFTKKDWRQINNYLKAANLQLGILINFNCNRLIYKRILNRDVKNSD